MVSIFAKYREDKIKSVLGFRQTKGKNKIVRTNMKYAVVTGASSGIGQEFARQLHKRGFRVILAARREERLAELTKEFMACGGPGAESFICDLKKRNDCMALAKYCKKKHVTCVVNAAGIGAAGWFTEYPLKQDLELLELDVQAVLILTKLFLRQMKTGVIFNVASTAGFQPGPGMTVYGAAKAFLISFGQGVNYELKQQKRRVHVVTVCPGPVDTEFDLKAGILPEGKKGLRQLFKISATACVNEALTQAGKGKSLIVTGRANRWLKAATYCMPKNLLLAAEYRMQSKKFKQVFPGTVAKYRLRQEQERMRL